MISLIETALLDARNERGPLVQGVTEYTAIRLLRVSSQDEDFVCRHFHAVATIAGVPCARSLLPAEDGFEQLPGNLSALWVTGIQGHAGKPADDRDGCHAEKADDKHVRPEDRDPRYPGEQGSLRVMKAAIRIVSFCTAHAISGAGIPGWCGADQGHAE